MFCKYNDTLFATDIEMATQPLNQIRPDFKSGGAWFKHEFTVKSPKRMIFNLD